MQGVKPSDYNLILITTLKYPHAQIYDPSLKPLIQNLIHVCMPTYTGQYIVTFLLLAKLENQKIGKSLEQFPKNTAYFILKMTLRVKQNNHSYPAFYGKEN